MRIAFAVFMLLCILPHAARGKGYDVEDVVSARPTQFAAKRLHALTFPDSLPATPTLLASIDSFHARQARIRLLELLPAEFLLRKREFLLKCSNSSLQ